ncbi:MAG: apolipoprotein N-acyltransferase [Alphaproteobacteria bacterium]|nr:apolipoprotein N-acyltransferase [Alphaproteobacteria bacterium]
MEKLAQIMQKYHKTTSLLLGLLLTLALPPYYLYPFAVLAFSAFFWLINRLDGTKKICAAGYFFGFGFFAGGFYWIGNALLIDLARTGWLYPITLFLNGAFFGIFTILPALGGASKKFHSLTARMLIFAALWGFSAEWVRSWFFSGFPWNPLSSVLLFDVNAPQALALFGTYGLSALCAFFFVFPALFLLQKNWKTFLISVFVTLIFPLGLMIYGASVIPSSTAKQKTISVRLVQPSLKQTADWSKERAKKEFDEHLNLSKVSAGERAPDFIIWGETASPFDLTYDQEHAEKIAQIMPKNSRLITGMIHRKFGADAYDYKIYNSLALLDDKAQVVDLYSKNHLVPFGEYIPFRSILPSFIRPVTNIIAEFGRGEKYQTITPENFPEFAPLICYEIIFSDNIVRKNNNLKWIVLLTFDGWYGNSAGPYQHLAAAQMRAIEEGLTIVRAANSGISAVISPFGEILAKLDLNERGVLNTDITLAKHHTLFGTYGNFLMWGVMFILSLTAFVFEIFCRRNLK